MVKRQASEFEHCGFELANEACKRLRPRERVCRWSINADVLDDDDDVQTVWGNYEISDAVMEKIS